MDNSDDNSNVDKLIDANLRKVYDSVLHEDVPDRFAELLRKLEAGRSDDGAAEPDPSQKREAR